MYAPVFEYIGFSCFDYHNWLNKTLNKYVNRPAVV